MVLNIMTKLLTPEETAEKLRISPKTVRDWLRDSKIQGQKVGRQWRIKEEIVEEIIQQGLDISNNLPQWDNESKDWLSGTYDEDLPEYEWGNKKPKMKKVLYISDKGFMVED